MTGSNTHPDILLSQLRELSLNERTILGLFFYEKLTVIEIATVLNWQIQKVENTLQRVLPRLLTVQNDKDPATEYTEMEMSGQ